MQLNYERIAKAIAFIQENFKNNLSLDVIAAHVHMSPFHFQRLFTEWAGVSPKKFRQYLQTDFAKRLLREEKPSLFDAHLQTGLSSTSRLHDLFVQIEGMTPAQFKNQGQGLEISYQLYDTLFGPCFMASTHKGICSMSFTADLESSLSLLKKEFPLAHFIQQDHPMQQEALAIFDPTIENLAHIKLHMKGTAFQLKVWQALLAIPAGSCNTYKQLAETIGHPKAYRAVGTAIGQNPIAYLIPCHRVIQASGHMGGYRWEPLRKKAILGWEFAHYTIENEFETR